MGICSMKLFSEVHQMKLHYKGKYNLNPEELPHGEHQPGAVKFKEVEDSKQMAIIGNVGGTILILITVLAAYFRHKASLAGLDFWGTYAQFTVPILLSMAVLFPHELLHAICFKEDVYLYTNWKQGMLFVVGPETMSKGRFVFMSLLPNMIFGFIPFGLGMVFDGWFAVAAFGAMCIGSGFGDYYNVFNALTQMPKGARTYLYQFNSYWYMP